MSDHLAELSKMAAVYRRLHQLDKAEPLYRTVICALEKSGEDPKHLALALFGLAEVFSDQNKFAEASPLYKHAASIWERLHPTDGLDLLWYSEALTKMQECCQERLNADDYSEQQVA